MSQIANSPSGDGITLSTTDPAEISALHTWLRGYSDIEATLVAGQPQAQELGVLDVVTVVAGSAGLATLIKIIPDFIRSRRSDVRIEMTVNDRKVLIDAKNVDEVMPIVERFLER